MNILFVCSQNKWRSPTAEKIYSNDPNINTRSAGTSSKARRKITKQDLVWADLVVVMENKHLDYLQRKYAEIIRQKPIENLHIPDRYQFMDPRLIDLLKQRMVPFLSQKHKSKK